MLLIFTYVLVIRDPPGINAFLYRVASKGNKCERQGSLTVNESNTDVSSKK